MSEQPLQCICYTSGTRCEFYSPFSWGISDTSSSYSSGAAAARAMEEAGRSGRVSPGSRALCAAAVSASLSASPSPCPFASRSGSFASSLGSENGCWENSCWRTCSLVKHSWRDIVPWSGRVAHGEWPTGFSVGLINPHWLQLESKWPHRAQQRPLWRSKWPPMRIENDNPLVSITPGELDNDNLWVTLTLTLTGQGLQMITHTHTHTDTHTLWVNSQEQHKG